jgi:hypothetical protein
MAPWKKLLLRSAGFGAGFAISVAVIGGLLLWWSNRPKQWSSTAITAKQTEIGIQQDGEELHFRFRYALTNKTSMDYALPSPISGALMRRLPEDSSIQKIEDAKWDESTRIPPDQTVNVYFEVAYKFSDFDTSAAKLYGDKWVEGATGLDASPSLTEFVKRRLASINGMVFLDYVNRFRIELRKKPVA